MKTVTLKSVIDAVAAALGWMPHSKDGLRAEQRTRIVATANEHARRGWKHGFWPEALECEERTVETEEGTGRTYVATAPGESDAWTEVDAALGFYDADPLANEDEPRRYAFRPGNGKLYLTAADCPASVWLEFRRRPPVFSGEAWDETRTYAKGAGVYDTTTGESYAAIATSPAGTALDDADVWTKTDFPEWLSAYVIGMTTADLLGGDDRRGRGDILRSQAQGAIADAYEIEREQQGGAIRADVAAR